MLALALSLRAAVCESGAAGGSWPFIAARTAARSSGLTRTSRALEPSEGPTTPLDSRRSMSRPALAKPTRSLRCSMELPLDVLHHFMDLGFGDPGALDTHRLGRAHGQEEGVALADQLLGAGLVEDHAGVGDGGRGEGHARRHVGLDEAGDHVHGR